jgi:hypothetical protein
MISAESLCACAMRVVHPPGCVRSKPFVPSDPPDQVMIEKLQTTFRSVARIADAWVIGARLTPIDGSPAWETTDVVLVLDPPITRDSSTGEISALEKQLDVTGWRQAPHRNWIYADSRHRPAEGDATRVYSRVTG